MLYFCLIVIFISIALVSSLIYFNKEDPASTQIIDINILNNHISQSLKKCKISNTLLKNSNHNANNGDKLTYLHLKRKNQISKFISLTNSSYLIYTERLLYHVNINLAKIIQETDNKLNNNKQKYRAIRRECIIETVANSYAHAVLLQDQFNVFESFKNLCQIVKVYKKEAEVLSTLIIANLVTIYIELLKDIKRIKNEIKKGSKIKRTKNNMSAGNIYGCYMFNPSFTKLYTLNPMNVIQSTSSLIDELDHIYLKQKTIYNYINFLHKRC